VSTALAPFLGGWLIDAVSWRMVFLVNIPLAAAAAWMALRHVPETVDPGAGRRPDWLGALAVSVGLAGIAYALIEGPERMTARVVVAIVLGVAGITGFVYVESRVAHPMLPLSVFRSSQFVGANLTTLAVYGALGGAMFLLVLQLQLVLGYSALEAGAAMLPVTVLLLFLSARSGALAQRIGPRLPMTVGPILVGIGLFWF
jgi:hypothetical protein